MPRLEPITGTSDVPAEHHAAVNAVVKVFGGVTAGRERESAYPWAAQVHLARRNGVRDEVIDVIRTKGDPVHYFALVAGVANAVEIAPPAGGDARPA